MDLETLRTALIITLSIALVIVLWRRFRDHVVRRDLPVVSHAELITLEVMYHPARLRVHLKVPGQQTVHTALLDGGHQVVHHWPQNDLATGEHLLEQDLPDLRDGGYYLEMRTDTQRTVRLFRLRHA